MRRECRTHLSRSSEGFVKKVIFNPEFPFDPEVYPFTIPAVLAIPSIDFHPQVTFLVGENGSGKSTIVEGLAVRSGFCAEGGTKNFNFSTKSTESSLHKHIEVVRGPYREEMGFFLRAESFYNVATQVDELGVRGFYGGISLHAQSHGESFMALIENRFQPRGLFILDEPEAALSPQRQIELLRLIHDYSGNQGSQFIIATHSPILMAYPHSTIYKLNQDGLQPVEYEKTDHYLITLDFLENVNMYRKILFDKRLIDSEPE